MIATLLCVLIIPFAFKKATLDVQNKFSKGLSLFAVLVYVMTTVFAVNAGEWTVHDFLPLQLCTISFFICILVLFIKKQWLYEWAILVALPSGLHSILTPELSMGLSNWYLFEYYFVHIFLMVVPLYLTLAVGMRLRVASW